MKKKEKTKIKRHDENTSAFLKKALNHAENNDYVQAYNCARKLKNQTENMTSDEIVAYNHLMAFASYYTKKIKEAEKHAKAGRRLSPGSLDFYFISAICSAHNKNYSDAGNFCETYLTLHESMSSEAAATNNWNRTINQKHQILSAYGVSLNESQEYEKAEAVLKQAIDLNPSYESSYINLALVYKSQSDSQKALDIVRQGLKANPDSKQLKSMIEWSGKRATISACMIVKNEEELLDRCLKSIHDVVDEIILVDTGSTDKTVEIAEKYGCKIYHYPWQGDFSSARNESMKYASMDWIFIIDADEEFPPEEINKLRVVTNQEELDIISINCINKSLETGQVTSFLPSVRLIRRKLKLSYFGIVHNRLDIPEGHKVLRADVDLHHYGYDLDREKMDEKLARTRKLLNQQLSKTPDDVYANFNMAQLLRGYKDGNGPEKAKLIIEHASKVIENPESKLKKYYGQRLMAFHQKAIGLCNIESFDEAENCCLEALAEKEDYLDPILTLGDIYNYKTEFVKAEQFYNRYLESQSKYDTGEEITNIILHNLEARHKAWYGIGLIGERTEDKDKAINAFQRVIKNKTIYLDTNIRLAKACLESGKHDLAIKYFKKEITEIEHSGIARYGLGCAYFAKGDAEKSIRHIKEALYLSPKNADWRYTLSKVYKNVGQEQESSRLIIEAAQRHSINAEIYFEAGNIYFEQNEIENAIEMYNKALAVDSGHFNSLNNLGNCYFKSEQYDRACAIYEQVVAKSPEHIIAYRNLGLSYARCGKSQDGLKFLMSYSDKNPDDIQIYRIIGELFTQESLYSEAIGCFEKYMITFSQDYKVLLYMSDIYLKLGHVDSAVAGYQQVLSVSPSCTEAKHRLQALLKTETV
ncbi:MAG: tetratricopeptide repeat protein [candidate division Zixibacteria bacterium]|nr:tetratricopeptide repeat protein [candidate division Zixibacteria bacterium]